DGAVLPLLHLNGYKISSATIFGAMTDEDVAGLFHGYGYDLAVIDVGHSADHDEAHRQMMGALDSAYQKIRHIQDEARGGTLTGLARWPMLALRSPKGWTGVRELDGE